MMNTELYHHGVKGMKWGVRKSKYHSGPRHRGKNIRKNNRLKTAAKVGLVAGAAYGAYRLSKGRNTDMYSSLLRESNRFIRLSKSKTARNAVKGILVSSGTKAATTVLTGVGVYTGRKAAQKIFKDESVGKDIFLKKK